MSVRTSEFEYCDKNKYDFVSSNSAPDWYPIAQTIVMVKKINDILIKTAWVHNAAVVTNIFHAAVKEKTIYSAASEWS